MVVACDVNETLGRAFEAKHPGRVLFVKCDTRRREDLEAAAAAAAAMGRLTCWYNNAGVGAEGDVLDGDGRVALDSWTSLARVIDININATALGTYIALSSFDAAHGGVVITTASMAGLLPIGAPPVYSMSKVRSFCHRHRHHRRHHSLPISDLPRHGIISSKKPPKKTADWHRPHCRPPTSTSTGPSLRPTAMTATSGSTLCARATRPPPWARR